MAKNTIKLKKYSDVIEEYVAAAAVTPGMVLEFTSAGKVQAHQNAGQNVVPMVALEDELQGNGIDDNYETDDPVQAWVPYRGDQAYLILKDDTLAVTTGDLLESAGGGYVQKHEADSAGAVEYPLAIVGQALEDLDLSGSSGEESSGVLGYNKRIKVRIL